jgi:hypothetical protein
MLWRCALVSETGCLRWVVIFRVTSRQDLRTPCPAHAFCHCERKLGCIETKQIRDESQETGLHSHTNINRIPEAVQPRRLVRKEKAAFLHGENDRTSTFLRATTYNGLKNTFHIFHCPSTIFKGRALVPLLATFTYTDHRLHYYHQHSAYASAPQPLQARYLLHRFFNNESTTADQLLSDWSAIHCEPAGERLQLRKAQYDVVQQQLHATPCCALPNAVQSTAEIPWTGASSLFGCPSEPIWDGAASRARPVPSRPHLCKVCGAIGPTAAAYR